MDVFKLLSRSAKPSQALPTQNIPSAGAAANPQLFGHDEVIPAPETSKKRKRRRGQDIADETPALPEELDFFSEPTKGRKKKSKVDAAANDATTEESAHAAPEKEESGAVAEDEAEPYDEDECKKMLRLHKLKIVVLEDFAAQEEPEEESKDKKKKSKKRKLEKDVAPEKGKKKDKKQLFPRPLTSFAQLRTRYGISRRLAQNLDEQGYKMPTEVQLAALPLLLGAEKGSGRQPEDAAEVAVDASGRHLRGDFDLLTVAPTGSGKTIAFLIPIINGLLSESKSTPESASGVRAIIVAPTRELASQIVNEARKLAKGTGIKTALMKKGMEVVERAGGSEAPEVQDASEASDENDSAASDAEHEAPSTQSKKQNGRRDAVVKAAILVTTPLALLNALRSPSGKIAELPGVHYMVFDEADVLLDPLFREQTLALWNACSNPLLRVGLWSATMGSSIEALTVDTLNSRWKTLTSTTDLPPRPPLIRAVVGLKDTAIPNISHKLVYAATEQGKLLGLRQLLHPTDTPSSDTTPSLRPPFLVFTQTIPRAMALHSELLYDIPPEAGGSSRIAVLHANLSSAARADVMTRFRRGEVWVLITTDLLSRGVDFRGLNGVVNYDVPNSAAAYVHRVGRTGRAGREGGVAVTFYTQEDIPYVKNVANVIRASEKLRGDGNGDKATIQQWLLDALPTPSKRDKQQLKKRGNESRRTVKDQDGKTQARISTKSGYERRMENNLKGAKKANANREGPKVERTRPIREAESGGESEFEGFEE